jgi:hypothetical protein
LLPRLSPDGALQRFSGTAGALTPDQVEQRLRDVGPNQVTLAGIGAFAFSTIVITLRGEITRKRILRETPFAWRRGSRRCYQVGALSGREACNLKAILENGLSRPHFSYPERFIVKAPAYNSKT